VRSERHLLPKHAHLVVYEREADGESGENRQLVTIYDCGAVQKPPSAQLLGELYERARGLRDDGEPDRVRRQHAEPTVLVDEGDGQYVVRRR
jgi:hypothetical protein